MRHPFRFRFNISSALPLFKTPMSCDASTPLTPGEKKEVKEEPLDLELMACDDTTTPFTPRKDKALKREAMHLDGDLPTGPLEIWLDHYRPIDPPARGPQFSERKRAELVARVAAKKAAHKWLLEMRNRAAQVSATKWPRPRCHPQPLENVENYAKARREEQECRAQEVAKERASAAARISHLVPLHAVTLRGGRRIYRKSF
ncbi:hypothetical protein MVEN_00881700 [Mycena venus]|uniref:Uncharacterized protein n=1 Tax=Mycena venus TaxID=2733690 RepID=A0A8H6YFQ2_9AGAR|nr:hypothetical protein MVEN_00881700 [Mycena venus]